MRKMIIVCEESLRQYGDLLSQLVSLDDDKDGSVVGVKDGTVAVQVWTEKEYIANAAQISSEQYILFIGNSKMIQCKRFQMTKKYAEYGMQYCWLGKQSVLFVEKVIDFKEYDNFIIYANKNQANVAKLFEINSDVMGTPNSSSDEEKKGIRKLLNPIKGIQVAIVNAPVRGMNVLKKIVYNKQIEEQQYTCLVFVFYLNGLGQFLGFAEK